MWLYGYQLGFTRATVIQKRNPHDYFDDLLSEIPMYRHCERVVDLVGKVVSSSRLMMDNLFVAYEQLERHEIVPKEEIKILEAWLKDLSSIQIGVDDHGQV